MSEKFKIGDKFYKADSLTKEGAEILQDLKRIEEEIGRRQADVQVAQLARAKLIDELLKESVNFEEIQGE